MVTSEDLMIFEVSHIKADSLGSIKTGIGSNIKEAQSGSRKELLQLVGQRKILFVCYEGRVKVTQSAESLLVRSLITWKENQ